MRRILTLIRTILCFRRILRANELCGRALGLARKTARGEADGWVVSPEMRQEAVSALSEIYHYVQFGIRR